MNTDLTFKALQALNQVGATAAGAISARQTDQALKGYSRTLREEKEREGRALLGEQRAAFAKSGVDPGAGTALMLRSRQRTVNRYAAAQAAYTPNLQRFRLRQESTLSIGAGLSSAGGVLGKGVLDYYQNRAPGQQQKPSFKERSRLSGAADYNPRRIGEYYS